MLQNTINVIASEVKHVPEKKYSFVEYTAPPNIFPMILRKSMRAGFFLILGRFVM